MSLKHTIKWTPDSINVPKVQFHRGKYGDTDLVLSYIRGEPNPWRVHVDQDPHELREREPFLCAGETREECEVRLSAVIEAGHLPTPPKIYEECLVSDVQEGHVRVVTIDRNSTRYTVVFTKMPAKASLKGRLVTLTYLYQPQASMFIDETTIGAVFTHFIGEKMNLNDRDAAAVAEIIAHVLGWKHVTIGKEDQ